MSSATVTPVFHLIAGPNGAGKSTLFKALRDVGAIPADAEFVNADIYEAVHLQAMDDARLRSAHARAWAEARRAELISARTSFVSETVFSHPSKIALVEQAQSSGFVVVLYVVALDDVAILVERVAQRVREGGHDVPRQRILDRYERTLTNLQSAVRMADVAVLYDSERTHRRVATLEAGVVVKQADPLPAWARRVLQYAPQV